MTFWLPFRADHGDHSSKFRNSNVKLGDAWRWELRFEWGRVRGQSGVGFSWGKGLNEDFHINVERHVDCSCLV